MSPEAQALLDRVKRGERVIRGQEDKRAARELFRANLVQWRQESMSRDGGGWRIGFVLALNTRHLP